ALIGAMKAATTSLPTPRTRALLMESQSRPAQGFVTVAARNLCCQALHQSQQQTYSEEPPSPASGYSQHHLPHAPPNRPLLNLNSSTTRSSASVSSRGLPSSTARTYHPHPRGILHRAASPDSGVRTNIVDGQTNRSSPLR